MKLSNTFLDMLLDLPDAYEDDSIKYDEFINTFGTHYFGSAKFGGYLYQKTIITNSYLFQTSEKDVKVNVKTKFDTFFVSGSASVNVEKNSKSVDENFDQNSETHFHYFGGKTNIMNQTNNEHVRQWLDTVNKDPWLVGGQLTPIEEIITNEKIKSQVKKAISIKRARAFMVDFKDTLKLGKIVLPEKDLKLIADIDAYLKNPKFKLQDPDEIGQSIENLFDKVEEIRGKFFDIRLKSDLALHFSQIGLWLLNTMKNGNTNC